MGTVTNTLYRGSVEVRAYDSGNALLGSTTMVSSNGTFDITGMARDMSYFVICIPKASLPSSGTYTVSMDFASDFTMSISNVRYRWFKVISSATSATGFIPCTLLRYNNAGDFYDGGTVIDLSANYSELRIHVNISNSGQVDLGGSFRMNLALNQVDQGVVAGTAYNADDNSNTIVNQNEQIISEQNRTNGLLEQIIQHISDQLYALWNQLYNLMALPWKTEQHNDSLDTQDKIEEESNLIQSAISNLGNFIINGLKGLFIPSDGFFDSYFDSLYEFFDEHLGVLGFPLTLTIRILNSIRDSIGQDNYGSIYFPGVKLDNFPIANLDGGLVYNNYVFVEPQTIRLHDNWFVSSFIEQIRFATSVVLIFSVIDLARKKLEGVLNN